MKVLDAENLQRLMSFFDAVEKLEPDNPSELGRLHAEAFILKTHINAKFYGDGLGLEQSRK